MYANTNNFKVKEAQKKDLFKSVPLLEKQVSKNLKYKILAIFIFSLLSVLIISKLILETKIYIPGFGWIAQTIVYKNETQLNLWSESIPFDLKNSLFFIIIFGINLILAVPAYFLIGKNYTKLSMFCSFVWTVFGFIFSLNAIQDGWKEIKIFDFKIEESKRTQQISYYIISFFSGIVLGITGSIIWRQNITAGGLDFIYTYLAIKKKQEIHKISLPITFFTLLINILVNETSTESFNLLKFISLLIASLVFMQTRNAIINYLFPKYKIATVMIITKRKTEIVAKLKKFYKHGGNIIQTNGLYKNEKKDIIITSMTFLEKNAFIKIVNKVDPEAFFVGLPTNFIEGKFNFFNN